MTRSTFFSRCAASLLIATPPLTAAPDTSKPLASPNLVFEEKNGLVAVEAEHFFRQSSSDKRAWHITTSKSQPDFTDDADIPHVEGASGGAYLECLPDTRHNHGHKLISGENFANEAGRMALLHYKVHFNTPGRYYVWARAYSTGSEDNGIHVGLDDQWPASGQRLQWCEGKNSWRWDSKQRTKKTHCGEPHKIFLDITNPGPHTISFSMREDGFEFDKWLMTTDRNFNRPESTGPQSTALSGDIPAPFPYLAAKPNPAKTQPAPSNNPTPDTPSAPLVLPRQPHGDATVTISGELKRWHKVTLNLNGPFAAEGDNQPNPFTDYRMSVRFTHQSGSPSYSVPGYFAADGNAANSSATSGTQWRAHLSPDKTGPWKYHISFAQGPNAALNPRTIHKPLTPYDNIQGSFNISPTDKPATDLRAKGRLVYTGKHHLRFSQSGEYFLKAGADAPETLLAYTDFDGTRTFKTNLKSWKPHLRDWKPGDPTWKDNKGKGLIGALNYLAGKGCNAFSFLTYNAGGDGDNVWPFVSRNDKLHYDCSKLDQWQIVFDHAQSLGLYLHFKMQEQENDDNRRGNKATSGSVPASLDNGALGHTRMLYCRELIARFGHELALNWNLGEENTQSTTEQRAMAQYIHDTDPYHHLIVVHTFPNAQDKVYNPLLGKKSVLTGASLQNHWDHTHQRTLQWIAASAKAGKPWVVANDEQGSAAHGVPPDPGYQNFDGKDKSGKEVHTLHDIRHATLWGNLMAGGAGVEYYFGYQLPENDLICEDWRSRDQSWDYCRIALQLFRNHHIPFWDMSNANALVGNSKNNNSKYCLALAGDLYLVYLPNGGTTQIDLSAAQGTFQVQWFNPRSGGPLQNGSIKEIQANAQATIGTPAQDLNQDWLAILRRNQPD